MSRIKRHRTTRTYIHTTSDTAKDSLTDAREGGGRRPGAGRPSAYGVRDTGRDTGYGYVIRLNVRRHVRMYYLSGNPNIRVTLDPRIFGYRANPKRAPEIIHYWTLDAPYRPYVDETERGYLQGRMQAETRQVVSY